MSGLKFGGRIGFELTTFTSRYTRKGISAPKISTFTALT